MTERQKVDRPWRDYPVGTKACGLFNHWIKTRSGWQSQSGLVFRSPGADAVSVVLPKYETPAKVLQFGGR